jgi:hypothetical protein
MLTKQQLTLVTSSSISFRIFRTIIEGIERIADELGKIALPCQDAYSFVEIKEAS